MRVKEDFFNFRMYSPRISEMIQIRQNYNVLKSCGRDIYENYERAAEIKHTCHRY
jgi:hypothetical protein